MPQAQFDAGAYWKSRLRDNFDLTGVGFLRRSEAYNKWVYRVRTRQLDRIFQSHGWPVKGRAVLDIGCGTGYFIDHWLTRGADPVVGVDVAEVSVERLREKFPGVRFHRADISEARVDIEGTFDYVSIFDVLYHIVDDRRFEQAVANLSGLCRPGARVIITDMFGAVTTEVVKHVRNRSAAHYQEVFSRHGFSLKVLSPLFFTLMPPARLANKAAYWAGTLFWEALTLPARWQPLGKLWGAGLYGVDAVLRQLLNRGPSHHLAVFEYEGTGTD